MTHSATIKEKLLALCHQWIDERIANAQTAMRHAQEAANNEEKSSAGDKYETGRAMAQNERDRAAQQMEEALSQKSILNQINPTLQHTKATLGSLVRTDKQSFFISISAGKLVLDTHEYMAISVQSPIGKLLMQTTIGQSFTLNKQVYSVVDVK